MAMPHQHTPSPGSSRRRPPLQVKIELVVVDGDREFGRERQDLSYFEGSVYAYSTTIGPCFPSSGYLLGRSAVPAGGTRSCHTN